MSINIFAFTGCAVAACLLTVTVRQYKPELAACVSAAASVVLLCCLAAALAGIIERVTVLSENVQGMSEGISVILKAIGICIVTQAAADVCRDCGESSAAGRIETGGRIAVVITALPLFADVLSTASELIGV